MKTLLSAVLVVAVSVVPALSQGYGDIDFGTATDSGSEGDYDTQSGTGSDYGTTTTYTPKPSYSPVEEEESGSALSAYISIGYGLGIGGVNTIADPRNLSGVSFTSLTRSATGDTAERKDRYLNYGSGLKFEIGASVRLAEHACAQFEVAYTAGIPKMDVTINDPNATPVEHTTTYTRNVFGIKALVVPSFKLVDIVDVRAGAGLGIFFAGVSSTDTYDSFEGSIETKPALAFVGLLGGDYAIGEMLALFADINFEAMSFTVKEQRRTSDNVSTHYERNSTAGNEYTPPKIPGSNVELRFGVRLAIL